MSSYRSHRTGEKWVVADFETTTKEFYDKNGYTKVWLWAIADNNGNALMYGDCIETFLDYCKDNLAGYTIYFHNLRFDGSFILNKLIESNYKYVDRIDRYNTKTYSTLISDMGQWYSLDIVFTTKSNVRILDSLKLIPSSVKKIAEDFNLGEDMQKLKIDYNDYTIDNDRLEYVFHDVIIIAKALKQIKQEGMNNMTTASCAYHNYKTMVGKQFNKYFPPLSEDFLMSWRGAYRGGRSQVNPRYAEKICYNVKRFDVNSMYPHIMRNLSLPYGMPIPITKINTFKFELYKINVMFKLKEGHLPTLLKKFKTFGQGTYYEDTEDIIEIYISNIDYELLLRHYDILYIDFLEMYGFTTVIGLFKKYVDYWYEIKSNCVGAKRNVAKLMLNSLYGKFGSNPISDSKLAKLGEDGLEFELVKGTSFKSYYLPIAIAITSWAHKMIDDAIMATGYKNFVYCDTDSIHTLGTLPPSMIDNKMLGRFKLEGIEDISKYIRQKCYIYGEKDENGLIDFNITCAGMNEESKKYAIETEGANIINIFNYGYEVTGTKLLPIQVKGGVILCPTNFKLRRI